MAELLNKAPAAKEPFRVGKKADIKVKANRPVLLGHTSKDTDPVRVEKGDIGYVTEEEFTRHAHILEKLAMVVLLLFACITSQAQSYSANQTIPAVTNDAWYSTNLNVATGNISGGAMAVTNLAASTTNTAMLTTPVGLTRYDQCAVMLSGNTCGSANTNSVFLWLYPSLDGVNVATSTPIIGPLAVSFYSTTNFLLITNLPNTVLGNIGYLQAGVGNFGTNLATNIFLQFFVKPQRSG